MKQISKKYNNGIISYKFYTNHLNQANGFYIGYFGNGNISWKKNYNNDKLFGIDNWYTNGKPEKITYHL